MTSPQEAVRASSENLESDVLLRQPTSELLGVSSSAAAALANLGIKTIFDLGTSNLFGSAGLLVKSVTNGDQYTRYGLVPGDLLSDSAQFSTLADIPTLPISALRVVPANIASELSTALDVKTIGELAFWLPYQAATQLVGKSFGSNLAPEDIQTEELRPRTGQFPTERVYYNTLVMLELLDSSSISLQELSAPISLLSAVNTAAMAKPAIGALLTFSQSWYSQGVTLGHLLHSLALAPGEATRIAVIDWSRRTRATTTEAISETEALDSASEHSRALSEVQDAVARDYQAGGSESSSSSTSTSSSVAASMGTGLLTSLEFSADVSATGQTATTEASAASSGWSLGNRSVLGTLTQNVNDRTQQHSTSVRNRRATAVREVSQKEHEQVSTRVVANYNHMHALTVQYYEVVQLYRTEAKLHRADRCLFIPVQSPDFSGDEGVKFIERFRWVLAKAALTRRVRSLLLDSTPSVAVKPEMKMRFSWQAEKPELAVWDSQSLDAVSRAVDRPVVQPDSSDLHLPDEVMIRSITFAGFQATGYQITGPAASGGAGSPINHIGFPSNTLLRDIETINLAAATDVPINNPSITLLCSYFDREFTLPAIPVPLSAPQVFTKVLTVLSGAADLQRKLIGHLQANRDYYGRAILRSLDSAGLTTLISGYKWNGRALIDIVEPRPLRVVGNYLVVRAPVDFGERCGLKLDGQEAKWSDYLKARGLNLECPTDVRLIPIPTGGVFAEAVLGRSNAAEKLDITRFWNWADSPIPFAPTEIQPVATGTRGATEELRPGQLSSPVLNILNPTNLPAPDSMSTILNALSSMNFRDMSGLAGTQSLVKAGMEGTLEAATDAGQLASANMRTEAQKAVAMGQIAADIAKSVIGAVTKTGGGGGSSVQGISAEGAKINHGRSMDERAISGGNSYAGDRTGAPAGVSSPDAGGSQTVYSRGGNGPWNEDGGKGSSVPRSNGFSREEAAFDQATFRFSPDAIASTTAPARDLVAFTSGQGSHVTKSGVQSGTYVVISVPDGKADKWAKQYVARQPLQRRALTMPQNPSRSQVLKTYRSAALLAGSHGIVIVNVGHGDAPQTINSDKDGWVELAQDKSFVLGGVNIQATVNVFYDVSITDVGVADLEYDKQHLDVPESKERLANWQVYKEIGTALRSAGVYKVVLLTCQVGNAIDFIKKIANDWGVVVEAYKDTVVLDKEEPSGRIRMYLYNDPDGKGSNVPLGEEELPLATEGNSYRAGPPLGSGNGASNPTDPAILIA